MSMISLFSVSDVLRILTSFPCILVHAPGSGFSELTRACMGEALIPSVALIIFSKEIYADW